MNSNIRINVIVNIVRTLVLTFLSFITFPWVCRYLGESQVGVYTWANTFVSYFLILAKVGLPNLAIRECVKSRDNKEELSNKAQTFFLIQLITTLLSFGLMTITLFSVKELRDLSSIIFILSLNFLSGVFSFEWIYIALEKQFYMSVRSIVILTISAILTICFVTVPSDIYIYSFICISVTIITSIINIVNLRKYISFKKTMPYVFKPYFKQLLIFLSLSLVLTIYNQTDTFILGFINPDKTQVASYSVGIKGVDIIIGIITALSTVFIPRSEYYYEKENKKFYQNLIKYTFNICMFIVLPAIATMTVLAKPICGLVSGANYTAESPEYMAAPTILLILSSLMFTYSIADIIYGGVLLPQKKEKYYLFAMMFGFILNIALSLIFGGLIFKKTPAIGVAIGTSITDLLLLIFLCICCWKWVKHAIFNKNALKLFVTSISLTGLSFLLYFLSNLICNKLNIASQQLIYLINILSVILIGGVFYLGLLVILKEDLVYSFIRNYKERRNKRNA